METWTIFFYEDQYYNVLQLALLLGFKDNVVHWFNRETDEGRVTVIATNEPDAYIHIHNAYRQGILIGYSI